MASIKEYLDQIRSAIYGEEVRGSIINAITAMNNESSQAKNEATSAEEQARISANAAKVSETKATQAQSHVSKIDNMTVSASKLESGATPSVTISDDGTKKHLSFGIPKGDTGRTPNISMTVSTGSAGTDVTVLKSGTAENPSFALTIPRGNTGAQGPIGNTPNISVKVNTGAAGSNASVSKSGTPESPVLTFSIPRGNTGAMPIISAKAVTGEVGTNANVAVSGTEENPVLTFTIPRGNKGDKGDPGPMPKLKIGTVTTGLPGTSASATLTGTTAEPVLNLTIPEGQRGATDGVPLSNTPAKTLGETASAGTSNEVSRSDHGHPYPNILRDSSNGSSVAITSRNLGEQSNETIMLSFKGYSTDGTETEVNNQLYKALQFARDNRIVVYDAIADKSFKLYSAYDKPTPNEIGSVSFAAQTLTEEQKAQARLNIGAGTLSVAPVTTVNGQTGDVTIKVTEDSRKLGGKAPEYYIQPINLLDNSDFSLARFIAQAGVNGMHGNIKYAGDRWVGLSDIEIDEEGITTHDYGIYQILDIDKTKVYTIASWRADGSTVVYSGRFAAAFGDTISGGIFATTLAETGKPYVQVGWIDKKIKRVALYEGSYTVETLPPYRPKENIVELAECQRYYWPIVAASWNIGNCVAGYGVCVDISGAKNMLSTATVELDHPQLFDGTKWFDLTYNNLTKVAQGMRIVFVMPNVESGKSYLIKGITALNADL